ncbi:family 78 glycoside hydrolase catalytic domain [Spirosoma validum]|uniref:alpha-L-rhamnosidase n=1 Tax=Spirosoma validum TaxID=2771355 RepID=A0A927B9G7_9BACT|nr:family 78 glycoside hydrolase catalytic domain [Spirosoma validum]MBD2757637.1 family 78 glycoside hydrolase catalytic domain [Spirosoma validum]
MKGRKITLLVVFLLSLGHTVKAQMRVVAALCGNRANPVGINPSDLFFSWEMQSPKQAVMQSAYQLVIASSKANVTAGKFDVFNTDVVKSNRSIQVHYSGKALQSAQTYFWKVRVWDTDKKSSAWSATQQFTTGIFTPADWKNARWIGYEDMPDSGRIVPFVHLKMKAGDPQIFKNARSPLLRKEFTTARNVAKALLFISGLGHYEASINGRRIGNAFLAPGWTSYDKTILYNTYDITGQLRPGSNAIGVMLGNGFYSISQERYVKGTGTFGNPKLIALLKITYTDGSTEHIISDKSWKATPSPITFNTIYGGEDYDARLEQKGWNKAAFSDKTWNDAVLVTTPTGKLLPEIDYPVLFLDSLSAKKTTVVGQNTVVYDFGQNCSGIPRINVTGKAGQTLKITPAELLHADGTVNQADGVTPHSYSYTLKGDGEEIWQPRFSYFAVRYVQIEGVRVNKEESSQLPLVTGLTVLHNRNAAPRNGTFACSNGLFNRIYTLTDWAIKSNLQSYITDNPQREKLSWQGEQNFMRTAINYTYNVYNLYRSLIQNMTDAQHENGLVPDIAPEYVKFEGPFVDSPEWGTTAILDSWFLYQFYGDTSVVHKTYRMMTRYADFLESRAVDNLLLYGLGDWLDIGKVTPVGITATAYYYHSITALSRMAELIGKSEDAARYRNLAAGIKTAFNKKFFNPDKKLYATGSQTAMAMSLNMGLVEETYRKDVLNKLVATIQAIDANRLTAGDVGNRYLIKALYENSNPETLFTMTNRDDVPGYGYLLKKGATALVETWDGKSSQNQLAMGHILEWFYEGIAGIAQEENSVAFKHLKLRPQPVGDLTWARGSFHSPYGWIKTSWTKAASRFSYQVDIPVNTTATVYLPAKTGSKIYKNGKIVRDYKIEADRALLELGSGTYVLTVE